MLMVVVSMSEDLIYVQTILTDSELRKLMQKSGKTNKKDALRVAVLEYIKDVKD